LLPVTACGKKAPDPAKSDPGDVVDSAASAPSGVRTISSSAAMVLRAMTAAPHELADCSNAELKSCLAPLVKANLGPSDIRALAAQQCFVPGGAEVLRQAADCLPLRVGTDAKRHKELKFAFYCSDICPDQGGVTLVLDDVSESECCKLEGEPSIDAFGRTYRGCRPWEPTLDGGSLFGMPDGPWYRVISSACPERAPLIVEEWPCKPPLAVLRRVGITGGYLPLKAHYAPNAPRHPDTDCPKKVEAPKRGPGGWIVGPGF
jgi:hypothetical protein